MHFLESTHESGAIVIDGHHAASTEQCRHCGNHEIIRRGSGKKRGWCPHCSGFVCGKEFCMKYCTPYEARIEWEEAIASNNQVHINKLSSRYPQLVLLLSPQKQWYS